MSEDVPEPGEGFLARWSRRKRAPAPPEPVPTEVPAAEPVEEESLDLSLLPDIETLTAESDVSVFLRKGVPEMLKNAALRKVWSADPAIRDFIGPVDYQWDFNDPAGVPGFGPLGSDVDVEALLKHVMGERPHDPPAENVEPVSASADEPRVAPVEDGAESLASADQAAGHEVSTPHGEEAAEIPFSQNPVPAGAISPEPPAKEEELPPLPRRHGGALPV